MRNNKISEGAAHKVPTDLRQALFTNADALERWEDLTPLARNEWICWTINVKTEGTRKKHVERVISELLEGKRRPCCWIGCIHRKDKPLSPSVKWGLGRQPKTK